MAINKRLIGAGATGTGGGGAVTPSENFNVVTYTGDGTAGRAVTVGFQPDYVWIKTRNNANSWTNTDSTRGVNAILSSNATAAESTFDSSWRSSYGQIASFTSTGFTVNAGSASGNFNTSGSNYVAYCWKANGGTTSSNTDGTITSTVQANQNAGFSIVKYNGNATNNATVGHGLSSAPELWIGKQLSGNTINWQVLFSGFSEGDFLTLNTTAAKGNSVNVSFDPTATTVKFQGGQALNDNEDYIGYCYHSVAGYSKIATYTGNGSDNGPIVETGFEPAFVMIKRSSSTGNWLIYDNKRSTTNTRDKLLFANDSTAEQTQAYVDFLSNGFQIAAAGGTGDTNININGSTYIYMCFAADPDSETPTLTSSFNAELYTGNGSTQSITGIGFSPNLTWIKDRSATFGHRLIDSVSGPNNYVESSSSSSQQGAGGNGLSTFDADGFTLGSGNAHNKSGDDFISWNWKANDNEATIEEVSSDLDAIAVYKFESNANDVTGYHNGTATDVTYVSGKFNNAADFNNTSSKIVIGTQSSVIPSGSRGVSFSFWVYLDSVDTSSNYDHWFIGQENYGGSFEDGEFSVRLYGGKVYTDYAQSSSIYRQRQASTTLSTGQWYHIVATYDTSNANITEVYLNGSLETTTNLTSGGTFTTNSLMQNSTNISIGGGAAYTDGKIDQFRIYDQVLTASNVTTLYNETASDNNDLNLGMTYVSSLQSIVSANANAGFSIVKYVGDGTSSARVPHGLSSTPEMIIVKELDGSSSWQVYHTGLSANNVLLLNSSSAEANPSSDFNNGGLRTVNANTFGFVSGLTDTNNVNESGLGYIAYCFHSVTGYSKFGSYAGNGTTNAITTGFKPDFVLIKTYDNSDQWVIIDSRRGGTKILQPNLTAAESSESGVNVSFTSTGFTHTGSGGGIGQVNSNGSNYIYWAIAKNVPSNTTLANSFKAVTYTGNGSSQSITGTGFRPDLVWIKQRSSTQVPIWYDSVRGAGNYIFSSGTDAQGYSAGTVKSFDSDGFSVGSSNSENQNSETFVAWCWKAGNTWQSNVDGTIPSTVNANTANGFSVVKYKGTGSTGTYGHGLSSSPDWIITKRIDSSEGWIVYTSSLSASNYMYLNSTSAAGTDTNAYKTISSTTIQIGTDNTVNVNGGEYIAYCWTSISGYSKFGSYTGNGSTQSITGLGFQPDWIMIKQTNATNSWRIFDSARGLSAPQTLFANLTLAEDSESNTVSSFDSDGWTMGSQQGVNDNGDTYIYMAFKMN